jgi:SSS family transporter
MTWLDWTIVTVYLCVVVGVGLSVGRKQKNTGDFFLAGRSLPMWAIIGSILATEVSAATLVAVPAVGYGRGLVYLQTTIGAVISRLLLGWLFIGVFHRSGVTTVYQYLAKRFGVEARLGAASVFLFGRLFASGVRLFIAAVAFQGLTGVSMETAILVAGVAAIAYGAIGGLEADVWTDVLQGFAFLAVVATLLGVLVYRLGGPTEAVSVAAAAGKTEIFVLDFKFWTPEFWANPYTLVGAVVGCCTLGLATHGTDQENVQRMLACKNATQARWSVVIAGLCDLPVAAVFAGIGVMLFAFYSTQPIAYAAPGAGEALTAFVLNELPIGFAGLLVVAVFAAAMSSIDSTLNAMAATTITDFYKPLWKSDASDAHYLRKSRFFSLVWGLLLVLVGLGAAAFKAANPQTTLIAMALGVMNLFYGSLLGAFLLGLFTRRGTSKSVVAGMVAGIVTTVVLTFGPGWFGTGPWVGWTWLIVAGTLATVLVGGAVPSPREAGTIAAPSRPPVGSRRAARAATHA